MFAFLLHGLPVILALDALAIASPKNLFHVTFNELDFHLGCS